MATKTDRILGYLPPTFRGLPRPTALFSVVDAVGEQLLQAENSLGAVMLSHWVDHADSKADFIADLACFAALYGLAPRGAVKDVARFQTPTCVPVSSVETVEEFREHLKRYVRTFLEGTVTVQGILRIVAEALGIHIADSYSDMDTWWTRGNDPLILTGRRADDAAAALFGNLASLQAWGAAAYPARVTGKNQLPEEFDLSLPSELRIGVDGAAPIAIDLTLGQHASLRDVVTRINQRLSASIANRIDGRLVLTSPTVGAKSRLTIAESRNDASDFLLGLSSMTVHGAAATAAEVIGIVPLVGELDLSRERFLRLLIDGQVAEVDCGGDNPAHRSLGDVIRAINDSFHKNVAAAAGQFLRLRSETRGATSRIEIQTPAAQDAGDLLFGNVLRERVGRDATAATLYGGIIIPGFTDSFDLSKYSTLRLAVDDVPPIEIDCAGQIPSATDYSEIMDAVNSAVGASVADLEDDGEKQILVFHSRTVGPSSRLRFLMGDKPDAATILFGILPRTFIGADATAARLVGTIDLSQGADLRSRHLLQIAMDGGEPVQIDLWATLKDRKAVRLPELQTVLNTALGSPVASDDGKHLVLTSANTGPGSSVAVLQAQETSTRRFVTRAYITDEAATAVFGFIRRKATGTDATPARLVSKLDLSQGVDLRTNRYLRLVVDSVATEIDCAARARIPRAATLSNIIDAINARVSRPIASGDGRHLILTSPTAGAGSMISLESTVAMDATVPLLGGVAPINRQMPVFASGRAASGVRFTGTVDLSGGVDLRGRDIIKIGIDGTEPVEIVCAGPHAQRTTLDQIVMSINRVFPGVASHDGKEIVLASHSVGQGSQLEFAVPGGRDATATIFGIVPPRIYNGDAAAKAIIKGAADLRHGVDLRTTRFLSLSINGGADVEIDCSIASEDPAHAQIPEIVKAINQTVGTPIASSDGVHLLLSTIEEISIPPSNNGDARSSLFGQGPYDAEGQDGQAAALKGEVDLARSVDLAERSVLRLAVDGGPAIDIDVAGAVPDRTNIDEIIGRINSVLPLVASADVRHLVLHSPTAGGQSSVEVLPLRALELVDYPPLQIAEPPVTLREANRFSLINDGAADSEFEFNLSASQGESGIEFVDRTAGTRVRVMAALPAGGKLALKPCGGIGVSAEIIAPNGTVRRLPSSSILAGRIGAQAQVPFAGEWRLSRPSGPDQRPALQLNNPGAPAVLNLHALKEFNPGEEIVVQMAEARSAIGGSRIVTVGPNHIQAIGRLRSDASGYSLVNESGGEILRLQGGRQSNYPPPDRLVDISGTWQATKGELRTVVPARVTPLFDVRLQFTGPGGNSTVEVYSSVTIGDGDTPLSLQFKLLDRPSQLARAFELNKAESLRFTRGSAELTYMNCHEARFNQVVFASEPSATGPTAGEIARFAGGSCREWAVFDISRFSDARPDGEAALFSASATSPDPPVQVVVDWTKHEPGAFVVNLPADLDEEFGARFNQDRFGIPPGAPEQYNGVITEPATDPDYIVKRINGKSTLVQATAIPRTPVSFRTVQIPFLHPRSRMLSGGTDTESARIYLAEDGVPGVIELQARTKGAWGNSIVVAATRAGNVRFDVTVGYVGLRFENARTVALAGRILGPREDPLSQLAAQILKPGPVGALQAKAAGVRVDITRDRTGALPSQNSCYPSITGTTKRRKHAR